MKTTMKVSLGIFAMTAMLFSFSACTKVEKVTETTFKYTLAINQEFAIPAGPAGTAALGDKVPTADIQKTLKDNGINLDKIKSIKIVGARMQVTTPAGGNFNEFSYAEASIAKADGSSPQQIGKKDPVPQNMNEISLDMNTGADFAPYFKETEFMFSGKLTRTSITTTEKKVKGFLDLEVLYQIL